MKFTRLKWEAYLAKVHAELPEGFEDNSMYLQLGDKSGTYIYMAFMTDVDPKEVADNLVDKLGEDDALVV